MDKETLIASSDRLKKELEKGGKKNPFWILGPCVIESRELLFHIAKTLTEIQKELGVSIVFKASFDKANRTREVSFRGPGMEEGLSLLAEVKETFGLPILTDIHETSQAKPASLVCDILQIPAFLSRQTDLIHQAVRTGRIVNIKKGQFMSPPDVLSLMKKLESFSSQNFWITERGVSFGYQRLVVDFAAFQYFDSINAPMILDITHAVQIMGGKGNASDGVRQAIPYLARAGAACGVRGFFAETHPEPEKALSDGPNAWPLDRLKSLIKDAQKIASFHHSQDLEVKDTYVDGE